MSEEDYKRGTVHPYGFTEAKTVQDFPIRGRAVTAYLPYFTVVAQVVAAVVVVPVKRPAFSIHISLCIVYPHQ
jgi:hypothetical protein